MRLLLVTALLGFVSDAAAQEIGEERTLGLGIELGSPTGVSGKYYFAGPEHALAAGVATEFIGFADDRLTVYAQYMWHPLILADIGFAELPLFIGGGAQLWTDNLSDEDDDDIDDEAVFGVRVPAGVDMNLRDLPLQISGGVAALVPVVPEIEFSVDISLTARYYF